MKRYNDTPDDHSLISMSVLNITAIKTKYFDEINAKKVTEISQALGELGDSFKSIEEQGNDQMPKEDSPIPVQFTEEKESIIKPFSDDTLVGSNFDISSIQDQAPLQSTEEITQLATENTSTQTTEEITQSVTGSSQTQTTEEIIQPVTEVASTQMAEGMTQSVIATDQTHQSALGSQNDPLSGNIFDEVVDVTAKETNQAEPTGDQTELVNDHKEIPVDILENKEFTTSTQNISEDEPIVSADQIGVRPEPETKPALLIEGYGDVLLMYQVPEESTIYGVSQTLGIPVEELLRYNGLLAETNLEKGKVLLLPKGEKEVYSYEMDLHHNINERIYSVHKKGMKDKDLGYETLNGIGEADFPSKVA